MTKSSDWSDVPVGHYLCEVRDQAGMTQAALATRVTLSTATLSRIESGDKSATEEEVAAILQAIGTQKALDLREYLAQTWDQLERPAFDHPDLNSLWNANQSLRKVHELRNDPDVKGIFIRQVDLYEKEIRRLCTFLQDCRHQVAFIGTIGVGKSTAICKLANLVKRTEEKFDRQIVLETGGGGITLCEVHITEGPKYGVRIEPRTEDAIRKDVEDFAEFLFRVTRPSNDRTAADDIEEGDPLGISKEVVRAIRNMAGLTEKRKEENGRRIRIDPAKELATKVETAQELAIQILTHMDLLRRTRRDAWYPDDSAHSPTHWLQQLFSEINNGRNPEFTLPQKIEVVVPYAVFENRALPLRLIDTKGIDQTAERQDLECHLDDARTLVVLCTRFNDAPEVAIQSILNRAKDAGVRDIPLKTLLLVLPRPEESLAVKHDDGTRVEDELEGYELKGDQIRLRLTQRGLSDLPVEFYNAREDSSEMLRNRLVARIAQQRHHYSARLEQLLLAVDQLIENREESEIEALFEHVTRDLGSWLDRNRNLDLIDDGVQAPLILAIQETRWASRVWAAVRRRGNHDELNYYHHLAYGVRKVAVSKIGTKIDELRVIGKNLLGNDELAPTWKFIERIFDQVDATVDELYRQLQEAGRLIFKQILENDIALWGPCEYEWGKGKVDGKGFRERICEMTDERLQNEYEQAHQLVRNLIGVAWNNIVELLETTLRRKDDVKTLE